MIDHGVRVLSTALRRGVHLTLEDAMQITGLSESMARQALRVLERRNQAVRVDDQWIGAGDVCG